MSDTTLADEVITLQIYLADYLGSLAQALRHAAIGAATGHLADTVEVIAFLGEQSRILLAQSELLADLHSEIMANDLQRSLDALLDGPHGPR